MRSLMSDVIPSVGVGEIVAAGLHNIDFATRGPLAVDRLRWEHPDGGPEPVADGEFGCYFDTAIFDGRAFLCVQACRLYGVDDGAVGDVGGDDAGVVV